MRFLVPLLIFLMLPSCKSKGQQLPSDPWQELRNIISTQKYSNIDGIIIAENNKILVEEYFNKFNEQKLHDTRSAFKSITGLLAGIAIDQGLFELDDDIEPYIVEWKNDPRGKITVKDLLEMRSGLACEGFFDRGPNCEAEMWGKDDWTAYMLDIPLRYDPGLQWEYTSMEPDLMGIVIARASGMNIMDFARKYLFEPLEITSYKWQITPDGRGYCAGSFFMKPIDMLKIAQLVLDKGSWNGKHIVSAEWIKAATTCTINVDMSFLYWSGIENAKTASARYGYLWYRERLEYGEIKTDILFASGNGGQYMMILEDYDTAIAFTGSSYGNWKSKLPFEIVLKYVIPNLNME